MSRHYEFGVFIGRFQPFHNTHLDSLKFALTMADEVIVIIGSCNQARDVKNPWTGDERRVMIHSSLSDEDQLRVRYILEEDFLYNDNYWVAAVQHKVQRIIKDSKEVAIIGHKKDKSSFYLDIFQQWDFVETKIKSDLDATRIRDLYFHHDKIGIKSLLPPAVYQVLSDFERTPEYANLKSDYDKLAQYRRSWEGAPFPPTFVTVDSIVLGSGHVLVVRRGFSPGKGLIALPGGFLNQDERILDGAIRELKEETGINLRAGNIKPHLVGDKVFDHPNRSLRGRTITHAFCFNLGSGILPGVKGSDDASDSWWMPFNEVSARKNEFFEDHAHIIQHFLSNNPKQLGE